CACVPPLVSFVGFPSHLCAIFQVSKITPFVSCNRALEIKARKSKSGELRTHEFNEHEQRLGSPTNQRLRQFIVPRDQIAPDRSSRCKSLRNQLDASFRFAFSRDNHKFPLRVSPPLRSVRLEPTVLLHARSRQQPAATNSVGFRQSLIDVRLAPTSGAKADIS